MGCMLCCFGRDLWLESASPRRPARRDYVRLRSFIQQIIHGHNRRFGRRVHAIHSASVGTSHLGSAATVADNSIPDTFCAPPMPLPFDDPRFSRQHEELEITQIEPLSHSNEQTGALQLSSRKTKTGSQKNRNLPVGVKCEGVKADSSTGYSSADATSGFTCYFSSSEDEDLCLICLEEYTSENPKETLLCSHVFHLCCIYEWMERSEACPICAKVMMFYETK